MIGVGLTIGLAAGVSPGPLMVLVITQTLRSGWRAGLLTAAAPLLSDAVVILGVVLVLNTLPARALPVLGVLGGLYVIWLGVESWRSAGGRPSAEDGPAGSGGQVLRKATLVNLLSPHPWITWATVLGPLTLSVIDRSLVAGIGLVVGFYLGLVGAKAVVALLVAGGRHRLTETGYARTMRVASILLVVAGLALIAEFAPRAVLG